MKPSLTYEMDEMMTMLMIVNEWGKRKRKDIKEVEQTVGYR